MTKVVKLPSFYTDVEEIADPPLAYYFTVSTVNSPENASNSDLASVMKKQEIEWYELLSCLNEFTSDPSCSVYNARKDDTEIVLCVNSVFSLLRWNVATSSMQKLAKNAIHALSPGQGTVDTSDQSVYALSRQLQQCFLTLMVLDNIYPCLVDSTLKNFFYQFTDRLLLEVDMLSFLNRLRFQFQLLVSEI